MPAADGGCLVQATVGMSSAQPPTSCQLRYVVPRWLSSSVTNLRDIHLPLGPPEKIA
jgi:hypothetical protein